MVIADTLGSVFACRMWDLLQ